MLNMPHICKTGNRNAPLDWTYHEVASLLEDIAPMTSTEKDALRMFVSRYADKVARQDERETPESIADTLDAMADFMHGYAEHFRQVLAD